MFSGVDIPFPRIPNWYLTQLAILGYSTISRFSRVRKRGTGAWSLYHQHNAFVGE